MSPGLRNLLALVAVTAAGVAVYTGLPTTTIPQTVAAGITTDCAARIIVCPERIGPALRARLAAAGDVLPASQKYAKVAINGWQCPNLDGGVVEVVAAALQKVLSSDDYELPDPNRCSSLPCSAIAGFCASGQLAVRLASVGGAAPDCVRAPVGVLTCLRDPPGAAPAAFFGEMNVFPAAEASGPGCQPVACTVMSGDNPDVDL